MEVECWVERQHLHTRYIHRFWGRKLSWGAKNWEPLKEEPELSMWMERSPKRVAKTEENVDSGEERVWASVCRVDGEACQLLQKTIIFPSHLTVYPLSTLAQLMRVGLGCTFNFHYTLRPGSLLRYTHELASLWSRQMKLEKVLWEPDD